MLTPLLEQLIKLQAVAGITNYAGSRPRQRDDVMVDWDEIVETVNEETAETAETAAAPPAPAGPSENHPLSQTVECQTLYLPSNGNVTPSPFNVELLCRQRQAQSHISQLRELIADKSFQYSHIIRVAPRKSIKTKGRVTVKGLNTQIAFHCHVYGHCRSRMIRLGADSALLQLFPALKKEDIRASTAILAPNMPGSTRLQLSWIWNDVTGHILPAPSLQPPSGEPNPTNSATILECMSCNYYNHDSLMTRFLSQTRALASRSCTTEPLARRMCVGHL